MRADDQGSGAPYVGLERGPTGGVIEAIYDYTDENGGLLFQIVRFRPKGFRTRRPDGQGGWTYGFEGVRRVLYRLPQVVAADTVVIVEGEKDVETAEAMALPARWVATCSPFGACQWLDAYSRILARKAVYICPDTDKAGRDHLMQVGLSLIGKAREIRVVALPPTIKDLSEWIAGGADAAGFEVLLREAEIFPFPREDSELVRDFRPLEDALALVGRLRGVVLEGRALPGEPPRIELGFLPHEIAPLVPGWISLDNDRNPAVCARGFEALTTAAIQELSADIRALSELRREAFLRLE